MYAVISWPGLFLVHYLPWLGVKLLSSINPVWLELLIRIFLIVNLPFIFKPGKAASKQNAKWWLPVIGLATGYLRVNRGCRVIIQPFLPYLRIKQGRDHCYQCWERTVAAYGQDRSLRNVRFAYLTGTRSRVCVIGGSYYIGLAHEAFTHLFSENGFRRTGSVAMVLSGIVMLLNSGDTLYHKEMFASV